MMYHQTKSGCKSVSSADNKQNMILTKSETTLTIANQPFGTTLKLMLMHHYAKFGYKRLSSSEAIVKIHSHFGPSL